MDFGKHGLTIRKVNRVIFSGISGFSIDDSKQIIISNVIEMHLLWITDGMIINNAEDITITNYDMNDDFVMDDEHEFTFTKSLDLHNVDFMKISRYDSIKKLNEDDNILQEITQKLDNLNILSGSESIIHEVNDQYYCCHYFYQRNLSINAVKIAEKNRYINFIIFRDYDMLNNKTFFTIQATNQTACFILAHALKFNNTVCDIFDIVFDGNLKYLPIPKIDDINIFNFLKDQIKSQIEIAKLTFTYTRFLIDFNPFYLEAKFLNFIKDANKDTILLVFQKALIDGNIEYHMILNEKAQMNIEARLQFTILAQNQYILSFISSIKFEDLFKR